MRVAKIQAVVVADTKPFDEALARSEQASKAFVGGTAGTFKRLDAQLKALADASGKTETEYKKMSAALKSGLAADAAARSLNKIAAAASLTDAEMKKLASSMGLGTSSSLSSRFNADNQAAQALNSTLGQLKAAVAGYVSFDALRDIAKTSVDIASMQKTFFAITGSMEGARSEHPRDLAAKVLANAGQWRMAYAYLTGQQQRMYGAR